MRDAERYAITLRHVEVEGESLWRATVRELPDVAEFAETRERAYELALETIDGLKQGAAAQGRHFPDPIEDEEEYTGRVTVRMPVSIHRSVAQQAEQEGVSLNSYIVEALTLTLAERIQKANTPTWSWPFQQGPQWDPRWILWIPAGGTAMGAGALETTAVISTTESANTIFINQSPENVIPLNAMIETQAVLREKRTRQ